MSDSEEIERVRRGLSLLDKVVGSLVLALITSQVIEIKANYDFRKDQAVFNEKLNLELGKRGVWMPKKDAADASHDQQLKKLADTQELLVCFVIAQEKGENCDPITLLEMQTSP